MLNEQYRMEKEIADIANQYYGEYAELQSNDNTVERIKQREEFYKKCFHLTSKNCVHLIDTKSLNPCVTRVLKGNSWSRFNYFSALVDVELIFDFIEEAIRLKKEFPSILIIVPYRPQADLINKLIIAKSEELGIDKEKIKSLKAGTIHTFQGNEADIVIFDMVIDEPHKKVRLFKCDKQTDEENTQLLNVAITRAKFKLYIVGNFEYCKTYADNSVFGRFLKYLLDIKKLKKEDAKNILDTKYLIQKDEFKGNIKIENNFICKEDYFLDYFKKDIQDFKESMIIYSPFITKNRVMDLLPYFARAIDLNKEIIIITKTWGERNKDEFIVCKEMENKLANIGVKIIHKKGMHEKIIFIDQNIVWNGSLNLLSFTGTTGEIMNRIEDENIVSEFKKACELKAICKKIKNELIVKCPRCKNELVIHEKLYGGWYWKCVKGDYSENF